LPDAGLGLVHQAVKYWLQPADKLKILEL